MKKLLLLSLIISLSGCVYSKTYRQWISIIPHSGPPSTEYSSSAHYQKKDTVGKTNSQERWKAFIACGATSYDKTLENTYRDYNTGGLDYNKIDKFKSCMDKRGYIYIHKCGLAEPKHLDRGLCNE